MDFEPSSRTKDYLARVRAFIAQHVEPVEAEYQRELLAANAGGDHAKWFVPPVMQDPHGLSSPKARPASCIRIKKTDRTTSGYRSL